MAINKLPEFAKDGQKNTDDLVLTDGFPVLKKPARQWFNWLFNTLTAKINEIIDADFVARNEIVNNLTTADATKPLSAAQGKVLQDNKLGKTENAVSATKLQTARKINGVNFDGTADILVPDNWQYIPYGADLNNYTTAGYYFCDQDIVGASVWNSPIGLSFSLIVEQTAGVVQRITGYFGANVIEYKRGFYGEWSEWDKVVSAKHKAETLQNVVTGHGSDEAFILEHNSKNGSGFFFDNGNGKTIEQYSSGFFASHKEGGFFTLGAEPLNGRIKAITGVVRGDNTVALKKTHTVLTQESTGLSYGLTTGFNTSHIAAMSPMQVADFLAGKSNNGGHCHYLALNGPTSGGSFPDAYGTIEGFSSRDNHYSYSWQRFSAVNGLHQYIRFALNDNTWSEWSSIALTSSNVASASKLQTPRNIAISGDVSGSAYFDGSGNIQINTSVNGFDNWKGQNGYTKLPNGLILQWGTQDYASNPGEVSASITFPITFPNNVLNINSTRKMAQHSALGDGGILLISQSNSGASFSLNVFNSSSIGDLRGFTWFAIGY